MRPATDESQILLQPVGCPGPIREDESCRDFHANDWRLPQPVIGPEHEVVDFSGNDLTLRRVIFLTLPGLNIH